ncbi:MAG: YkvA family protein [Candidatus Kaistia colombiensis]|nr:MAG: YkvA family protein [Kaistia sp.]
MAKIRFGDILGPDRQDAEDDATRAETVRRGFWKTFRAAARHIPFSEDVAAAYFCAFDSATPIRVRATLLGALAYFVLPIDAVPDFLVGIGFADDATVLMTALTLLRGHIRPVHYEAAKQVLAGEKPA